jgi:hypothetical protein
MPTAREVTAAPETAIGEQNVTREWIVGLSGIFIVATLGLLAAAFALWPPDTGVAKIAESWIPTREQNLLLLMAVLGGIGAMAYVLRSFSTYVGERKLVWSWVPAYILVVFLGAALATITYIVLRAGLIGANSTAEGNTWGFAAVSALVGLFNAQTASKLKVVFEAVFARAQQGKDSLTDTATA